MFLFEDNWEPPTMILRISRSGDGTDFQFGWLEQHCTVCVVPMVMVSLCYVTRVKYFRSATQLRSVVCLKELPSSGRVSDFQRIFFGISRLCPMMPPRISSVCLPAFFLKAQLQFTCCLFSCLGYRCKQTATVSQNIICLSHNPTICFVFCLLPVHLWKRSLNLKF